MRYSTKAVRNGFQVGWLNSQTTIRPPGRVTRRISVRATCGSAVLRSPKEMVTASKEASANGSRSASPATRSTPLPRPTRSIPREKSQPTTRAPLRASATLLVAVPAARSSTVSPAVSRSASATAVRQPRSWPSDSTVLVRS
jgi:hypothetical protein